MLTCKVGNQIINTFEHSDSKLRKWSNKGILKCPDCDQKMIYKNGEFKIAHFAHESECKFDKMIIYRHPETEEHITGKITLYNWLKSNNVKNLKLESWIPETKQRPDIYFEMDGSRYVIEYQCSPISTKFKERKELYKLAGIKDIWIFGFDKYNIPDDGYRSFIKTTKTIEREIIEGKTQPLVYLNRNNILITSTKKRKKITDVVKFKFNSEIININRLGVRGVLSNMDLFEEIIHHKQRSDAKKLLLKISRDMRNKDNIKNINISYNKIYAIKDGVKYLIEVLDDNRELDSNIHLSKGYRYVPVYLEKDYSMWFKEFKNRKARWFSNRIIDGNYSKGDGFTSCKMTRSEDRWFSGKSWSGKKYWYTEKQYRHERTSSEYFSINKMIYFE